MKYIRTKDGIYKVRKPFAEETLWEDSTYVCEHEHIKNNDILFQADTIEKLCDCFIVDRGDGFDPYYVKPTTRKSMDTNEPMPEIYGAIWCRGQDGVPTLKAVARMLNWKGDLELL